MAKKLKEDINLDEIDENFIISSFKTGGKVQASATDTAKEKVTDVQEVPQEQNQPEQPQAEEEPQTTVRTKENRETGKGKKRTVGVRRKVPETERTENTTVRVYQPTDSYGYLPSCACDSRQGYNGGRLYRYCTGGTSGKA